ncbi:MAG: polyprenyl synthetase family protein [Candidatus Omnitrophota bacterium]
MRKKAFYDTISHVINAYIKKINAALRDFLSDANRRYSLGIISDALLRYSKDFILRKGKRIRPLLFVLSYKGYTKRTSYSDRRLFTSAASIELLHDFMLIHDDVIDNSDLRRGKPTLHKIFDRNIRLPDKAKVGASLAIVAGDILFALAIESILSIDEGMEKKEKALRNLVQAAAYTGAGEFIDVVFGHKTIDQLSEHDIFLTYTLKTAKYTFECPLLMGAILAGAPSQELKKLSQLGLAAGQAFQIYDDFLDLFASERTIGKPVLTDLAESKKTLLVFKAYKNSGRNEKKRFREIFEKNAKTLSDLDDLRRIIVKSGSYDYCLEKMSSLQEKATRLCGSLKIKKAYKKALEYVIFKLSPSNMPFKL